MSKGSEDRIGELLDRTRRIETRLVKVGEKLGVETRAQKPIPDAANGRVIIPSMDVRLCDILAVLPKDGLGFCNTMMSLMWEGRIVAWIVSGD
jgi:hypothetical protein